jgi:nitrous oxidase accessory protein NosD
LVSSSRATANHLDGFNVGYGVGGYPSGGRGGTLRNVRLDGNGRHGFALADAPPGRYTVTDCVLTGNSGGGFVVLGGNHPSVEVQDLACTDSQLTGNGSNGVTVEPPAIGLVVKGCDITGNGQDTGLAPARRAGISLFGPLRGATIKGNDCRRGAGQDWGVYLADQDQSLAAAIRSSNKLTTAEVNHGVVVGSL